MQVPTRLRLLDVLANDGPLLIIGSVRIDGLPNLQVLDRIAFLVLCRALPCDYVGTQRRESQLVDIWRGQRSDDVTDGSVDNRDPR